MPRRKEIRNSTAEFLIFQVEGKEQGVEVYYKDKTVWCTQRAMGMLFDCSSDNIGLHLKNIYESGELIESATAEKISVVRHEGSREVNRSLQFQITTTMARYKEYGYDIQNGKAIIPEWETEIKWSAFLLCNELTSVDFPQWIKKIGNNAFCHCENLTEITLPEWVEEIGNVAFCGCKNLKSITLPRWVKKIGDRSFRDCSSLTSITIPPSVTEIGDWAFRDCSSLTSISIPESVTEIGEGAFSGCSSLTNITIPESVTEIGCRAFSHCSSLTSISIPPSVKEIKGDFLLGGTFSGCSSLTEVRIPKGCNVDENAFRNCPNVQIVRY